MDFEACEAFSTAIERDAPECARCGHLADDHARAGAQVTELPRRPTRRPVPIRRPAPARKAS